MLNRVRVRRDRPSALSWAVALAVTMLAVYLVTLGAQVAPKAKNVSAGVRVTRQIDFQPVTVYFADLGVYPDEWQARVAAAEYANRGAAGVVYEGETGFHVLGAGYELQADAQRIADRLSEQAEVSAGVLTLSGGAVSLRITAQEDDAEAVAAADRALRTQLSQLGAIALQVDREEISFASARTLARVAASEARKARSRLQEISGWQELAVCASMVGQLSALEKNILALTKDRIDGSALSGRLRCCHADGMLRLIDFLNNPGG